MRRISAREVATVGWSIDTKARTRSIDDQSPPEVSPVRSETTIVSATVFPQPGVVLRAQYDRVRALLVIALVVAVGLTYAVVALATTRTTTALQPPTRRLDYFDLNRWFADAVAVAELGARLDHRGEKHNRSTSLNPPRAR